jgi:glucokinase
MLASECSQAEYVVGVDFGGTKIMAGIYNRNMECIAYARIRTKGQKGPDEVLGRIARCVQEALTEGQLNPSQIKGLGIGAPGPVDPISGRVLVAPNLGWKDVPLKEKLEALLHIPVFLENDANVCALGVHVLELGGKPQHMIGIFIGTGIGSGLIINGNLYPGFSRTAGEIGHMILQVDGPECGCGKRGCFEALASRSAIGRRVQQAIEAGQKTVLTEMLGLDFHRMRSSHLRKAIARGDSFVEQLVKEAAYFTGIGVANVVNLLNPEFVVLGGGMIEQLEDVMMHIIVDTARHYAMPGTMEGVSIQPSTLADDAGIAGAAVLAFRLSQ